MIPIRDTVPSKNVPVINLSLIGINVVIFLLQLSYGNNLDYFDYYYGLVPARYFVPHIREYFTIEQQLFSLLSFMFLHGGFLHLLGNMWSLYIFGDNIEDRLGPARYLFFYLACGMASGVAHLITNTSSNIPTIGASGAIAGVMGAYFLLYPTAKILTLIPIIIIPWFVEIPAFFFLAFWFLMQFIKATGDHVQASGIAWWAHIGGFIAGMIFIKLFRHLPSAGVSAKMQKLTTKKKTHRLQVIHPSPSGSDHHLYGVITITPYEAVIGTRKLVNIPWGFQKRIYNVLVPSNIVAGTVLRLKGLGKIMPDGQRGDLLLKVRIE
ncbi:MAG: rhomboid family intramembrane serine protease [Desulfobacteraceae bacterium]|jgi:membrane associated rhomboid family serine protease